MNAQTEEAEDAASLTVTKLCPKRTGEAIFNVLIAGEGNVYISGTSLSNEDLLADDVTITDIIAALTRVNTSR